jgi:hypothetical protein
MRSGFLALCATSAIVSSASAATFVFPLSGSQEVPAVTTPATGSGVVVLSGGPGSYVATYTVTYSGLQGVIVNPPGAHIHNAPAGSNGGVVHFLDGVSSWVGTTSGTITGDWRFDDATNPLTDTLADQMLLGRTYFNLHTQFRTSGEIRGQIVPEPMTAALVPAVALLGLRRRRD